MQVALNVHVLLLLRSSKIVIINIVYIIWEKNMVSTKLWDKNLVYDISFLFFLED